MAPGRGCRVMREGGGRDAATMAPGDCILVDKAAFARAGDATEALAGLYQDRTPAMRGETARVWCFDLVDTRTLRPPRDPDLAASLARHFSTDLAGAGSVQGFSRIGPRGLRVGLACDHGWALAQWSDWLAEEPDSGPRTRPLLVHFDAHHDLGKPSVLATARPGVFGSPVDGDEASCRDPRSIARFLRRGLIGIGSFIVPLQHALGGFDILHGVPGDGEPPWQRTRYLELVREPVSWLGRAGLRPTAAIVDDDRRAACRYIQSNTPKVLEGVPTGVPILLDIDFDYFCNRYDSNRDGAQWATEAEIAGAMAAILQQLARPGLASNIVSVTFALSPDFFPSIHWQQALAWVEDVKETLCAAA